MSADIYDNAQDVQAWLDDLKGTFIRALQIGRVKRIEFQWKFKRTLKDPVLEFILEHELIAFKHIGFALLAGEEYFAALTVTRDGTWEIS